MKPDGLQIWNNLVETTITLPLVNVNRESFLRKQLSNLCDEEQLSVIIDKSPLEVFDIEIISQLADDCISFERSKTTILAAAAGIPGGWGLVGTVPADLAQFYGHVFIIAQKLLYLYGWPDLRGENGELEDGVIEVITLAVGVMMGVAGASAAIQKLAEQVAIQTAKKLPQKALTKSAIYVIVKQVATQLGIKVNKDIFAKGVAKVVPLLGAGVNGGLTYYMFGKMANKLKSNLQKRSLTNR